MISSESTALTDDSIMTIAAFNIAAILLESPNELFGTEF